MDSNIFELQNLINHLEKCLKELHKQLIALEYRVSVLEVQK